MSISFRINGKIQHVNLSEFSNRTSLITYLRSYVGLTGTKFMCLEGSCGACLVSVRQISTTTNCEQVLAIHSCLKLLYTCDGLDLTTIEGIGNKAVGYHPIQRRLHDMHGTQCGFCTPGMVVNIFSQLENNHYAMTATEIEKSLIGNTCRCTGYRPILDAFKSFSADGDVRKTREDPVIIDDIEDLTVKCRKVKNTCIGSTCNPYKHMDSGGLLWFRVLEVSEIFQIFQSHRSVPYCFIAGSTSKGVVKPLQEINILIDISGIASLKQVRHDENELYIGGLVTINDAVIHLKAATLKSGLEYCHQIIGHMELIGSSAIRNVATIAGNLALKHSHPELALDIFLLLDIVQANVFISDSADNSPVPVSPNTFLDESLEGKVIVGVSLPPLHPKLILRTYRMALRAEDAFSYINAGFSFVLDERNCVESSRICFGGISTILRHTPLTENLSKGKDLFDQKTLSQLMNSLDQEIQPNGGLDQASPIYRKQLAISLFYRFILSSYPSEKTCPANITASAFLTRPLSFGIQTFSTNKSKWPLTEPIRKYEGLLQSSGEANFCDDLVHQKNELWAAFAYATKVHFVVASIEPSDALKVPGVRYFFTRKDIPGVNSIIPPYDGTVPEQLFLDIGDRVQFHGQPVGVLLAESMALANEAAEKVRIVYTYDDGSFYSASASYGTVIPLIKRIIFGTEIQTSDRPVYPTLDSHLHQMFPKQKTHEIDSLSQRITGRVWFAGQYHFHVENQTTVVVPGERGYTVYCSSTWLDYAMVAMARCLALPESYFYMPLARIGGAFGGKERRTMAVACAAALASHLTQLPVRFPMTLEANMRTIGKRVGALGDYVVDFDQTGRIQRLVNNFKQDVGITANDIVDSLFTNAFPNVYENENWTLSGENVRTDSPTNTFFRAPGAVTAIAMVENIMEHIAHVTGLDPVQVRLANIAKDHQIRRMWASFRSTVDYERRKQECEAFNAVNRWRKRGLAVSMMSFPASYTGSQPVYMAIYHQDGSVVVTHGGVENGQGINTKATQIVSRSLGIPIELVAVRPTDNVIGANSVFTGASVTSEMVCYGLMRSCETLLDRMRPIRDTMKSDYTWAELTQACYTKNIDLRQTYQFSEGDFTIYRVNGMAAAEMEVDILTGAYQCRRADVMEDVGESMNPAIDVGQIEGAFVMGMGYWLTEQLVYDRTTGRLITNRAFNYKPPGVFDIPVDFRVTIWNRDPNPMMGMIGAKAVGEPPICMGVVTMFALRNALKSSRIDAGLDPWFQMGSGNTPEKVFECSGADHSQFKL